MQYIAYTLIIILHLGSSATKALMQREEVHANFLNFPQYFTTCPAREIEFSLVIFYCRHTPAFKFINHEKRVEAAV